MMKSCASTELYQRILSLAYVKGPPNASIFSYELAPIPSALFSDDVAMRKVQKSQLAHYIINKEADITSRNIPDCRIVIYDGCALLHRLHWPKIGTFNALCECFVSAVKQHSAVISVVFDTYSVSHQRNQNKSAGKVRRYSVLIL